MPVWREDEEGRGTSSDSSSSRLAVTSVASTLTLVRLPPGRARLATSPSPTGSAPPLKTFRRLLDTHAFDEAGDEHAAEGCRPLNFRYLFALSLRDGTRFRAAIAFECFDGSEGFESAPPGHIRCSKYL
jgi:hypothetical protein